MERSLSRSRHVSDLRSLYTEFRAEFTAQASADVILHWSHMLRAFASVHRAKLKSHALRLDSLGHDLRALYLDARPGDAGPFIARVLALRYRMQRIAADVTGGERE